MKEGMDSTQGFCMLLRKHLEGAFLERIAQVEPERIVKMIFSGKERVFHLYVELFGKGNVVLCNENNIIIDALHHQEFKDRKVEPQSQYKHPQMQHNIFLMDNKVLQTALASSPRDSLVKCLAIDLGMGGLFAEETCLKACVDKSMKPKDVGNEHQPTLLDAVQGILLHSMQPIIILEEGELEDVLPFPLESMATHEHKNFPTFSEALEYYMQHASPDISTSHDAKLTEMRRIIEQQEKNIASLEQEEKEQREKAEALYSNYIKLDSLLKELKRISEKHSWQEIKEKLKDHTLVKDVNPRDKSVVVDIKHLKS
jgi:predicted ribosome quality control (RQC) complex YloA/Tae2 family protein